MYCTVQLKNWSYLKTSHQQHIRFMKIRRSFPVGGGYNSGKYLNQLVQELAKCGDITTPEIAPHFEFSH